LRGFLVLPFEALEGCLQNLCGGLINRVSLCGRWTRVEERISGKTCGFCEKSIPKKKNKNKNKNEKFN